MLVCILRNENADLGGEILFPLIQDEEDDLDGMIGELQVELGDMQQRILEDNKRARYFFWIFTTSSLVCDIIRFCVP